MPMSSTEEQGRDLSFDVPNDLRAIETSVERIVDYGRRIGFNPDRLRLNLRVGLTEALANAMLYDNRQDPRKRVRVEATVTPAEISVSFTDEGIGFDPSALPDPTLPANIMRSRGRGIFLIRHLMDRVEFNEKGNSIRMVLVNGPGGPVAEAS
jgi:serine/threonine-protein kinase RsbW